MTAVLSLAAINEFAQWHSKRNRDAMQFNKADVPHPPFHSGDVGPMQTRLLCKLFLRPSKFLPVAANCLSDWPPRIGDGVIHITDIFALNSAST